MLRIGDANNFRRTLAGVALIAAPLAFGGSDVIRLSIEGGVREGAEQLAAIEASYGLWQVAAILNMVGIVLFVPAILGLMHLMRNCSVALGHIGGGLALVGFLGWTAHNTRYFGFMGAASTSEVDRGELVRFIGYWETTPDTVVYVLMFLVGYTFGMLLLAIGLYRARVTYRWASGLFLLGVVLYTVATFTPLSENVVAIATLQALVAAGLGATGFGVLAMSDKDWARFRTTTPGTQADLVVAQRVR